MAVWSPASPDSRETELPFIRRTQQGNGMGPWLAHVAVRVKHTRCRLLELPAELRNRIYEAALVRISPISVHKSGFYRPALLQTCKQIRSEAMSIFVMENTFFCTTGRYDYIPLIKMHAHLRDVSRQFNFAYTGENVERYGGNSKTPPDWYNLILSLHAAYEMKFDLTKPPARIIEGFADVQSAGRIRQVPLSEAMLGNPDFMVVLIEYEMYYLVSKLADKPWEFIEDLLLQKRAMLQIIDRRWGPA